MPVLQINNISKQYKKHKALDNLSMVIEAGNIYGILGPNGSGKTTTLGIILGILKPSSGSFEWFNGTMGDKYRLKIGALLETPNFYPYHNATKNLQIIQDIKNDYSDDLDDILKKVNLFQRKSTKFSAYSLGMKQRLAIAATLIGQPEVVIFDEPTNGLDPEGISEVRKILRNIADSGKTVIMASHLLDEVEKICSHVAIIKNGKLRKVGRVGKIFTDDITLLISSKETEKLSSILKKQPYINSIEISETKIECLMKNSISAEDICQLAFENNILLTHLEIRKRKLEDDFLEITKN